MSNDISEGFPVTLEEALDCVRWWQGIAHEERENYQRLRDNVVDVLAGEIAGPDD